MVSLIRSINRALGAFPHDIVALIARLAIGMVFFKSGLNKFDGFGINLFPPSVFKVKSTTFYLFENDWKLPVLPPELAAYLATNAELLLPPLLMAGLLSRLVAVPLILMTLVIQIFVIPSAYIVHGLWAAALLVILTHGPGRFSLDFLLGLDARKA